MKSSYRVLKETHQKIVFDLECEIQGLREGRRTHANLAGPSNAGAVAQPRRKWAIRVRNNIKHDETVCAVAYSSDGFLLASGTKNTTRLSNAVTGEKIADLSNGSESEGFVRTVCFSHDGKWLATAGESNFIRLWDVAELKLHRRWQGHQQDIYSVDVSLCSRLILSGSDDHFIKVWNLSSGTLTQSFEVDDVVTSVKFSPANSIAACGSLDNKTRLWNFDTNQVVRTMGGHTNSTFSVAFAPDARSLLTGSLDKKLMLWDLTANTTSPAMTFKGHTNFVLSVTFFNGRLNVLSGSKDNTVGIWDTRNSSKPLLVPAHENSVISVSRNPVQKTFATGSGDTLVKTWNYDETIF